MKSLVITLFAVLVMYPCFSQEAKVNSGAEIEFAKTLHDYGSIQKGGDGKCVFIFQNTGDSPLVLSNCKSSCGCTVPAWPKTPVAPGAKDSIIVEYNTNRLGAFTKSVTVYSNALTNSVRLMIKGKVE
ncbi:MAG: hypothetical protein C0594_09935 [Marinilabiliales bacterium]|nr:MAG: hypothetical protein C0594_09935 [Marinilabiliales bacterium]